MKTAAEKMVFGGDCIAKIDGKTTFIPYAIPGEEYEIEILKDAPDYFRAKIKEIIKKSEKRIDPACPLYQKCGGCNLMHIDYEHQLELKKQIINDSFEREGIKLPQIISVSAKNTAYRSRFQLHDGGLMQKNSNSIVKLDYCPCATEEINKYLAEIPYEERPLGRVHVFGTDKITSIPQGYDKIIIAAEPEQAKKKFSKIQEFSQGGRKLKKQKKIQARYEGSQTETVNSCKVKILDKELCFDVLGFFQSNLEVLEKAVPLVLEGIEGKKALDMYSGCGTFSVFLKDKFESVTMVEHNKSALTFAEINMAGSRHESYGVSGDVWVKYHAKNCVQNENFDAVVIDPPRSGMEKSVCQWLCSSDIKKIKSLSCDVATHARDAKFLIKNGYKITKFFLLDFYPHTGHIETLAWFEK